MTTITTTMSSVNIVMADLPMVRSIAIAPVTLGVAAFLFLLNVVLAIVFRKKKHVELLTYYVAGFLELVALAFSVLVVSGIIQHLPFTLPAGLPINQAEISAALAIGIGLFPAAYWHRVDISELPKRIAEDKENMQSHTISVNIREKRPDGWVN
ncbi:MAG TPA: hypothetical protein VL461_10700 [Dictyobacter sp.]|nr:hypothetical protein [Dictyobacter sp.]